jgi:hypothetical protein
MCLAYSNIGWLMGIWLGTSIIYGGSNKENNNEINNNRDLPIIKELLLAKL